MRSLWQNRVGLGDFGCYLWRLTLIGVHSPKTVFCAYVLSGTLIELGVQKAAREGGGIIRLGALVNVLDGVFPKVTPSVL